MEEKPIYLDFEVIKEPWNKYQLLDGTLLGIKNILTNARDKVSKKRKLTLFTRIAERPD